MASELDLQALSLDELRAERNRLQHEDDAVSYVRRIAQARPISSPLSFDNQVRIQMRISPGSCSALSLSTSLGLHQHPVLREPTTTIWQMTLGPSNLINSVPNTGSTAFHRGRN